jgi:putative transposase
MSKRKLSTEQIIGVLKQLEAGRTTADLAREVGVPKNTIYAWKAQFGGMEVNEAEELAQIPRSTYRFERNTQRDEPLRKRLIDLAQEKPRYGYRLLWVLIRWQGEVVNHKRLFRIYRAAGLSVKRKRRKRLVRVCQPRTQPTAPNEEWSLHFVHDRLANGRAVRVLGVVDTFTREWLALEVDTSFASPRVTRVPDPIIAERGRP